jgi:hypothetical protein
MNTTTHRLACLACIALASLSVQAEPLLQGKRIVTDNANGGLAVRSAGSVNGSQVDAAGQRRLLTDGNGNLSANGSSAFTTTNGSSGSRSTRVTRSADGSASGERSTTATNAETGVTFNGSTSYTKGSGASRSASCTDASGKTVTCGSAR